MNIKGICCKAMQSAVLPTVIGFPFVESLQSRLWWHVGCTDSHVNPVLRNWWHGSLSVYVYICVFVNLLISRRKYNCQADWIAWFGKSVYCLPVGRLLGKPSCYYGGQLMIEKYSCQVDPAFLTSALSSGKIHGNHVARDHLLSIEGEPRGIFVWRSTSQLS